MKDLCTSLQGMRNKLEELEIWIRSQSYNVIVVKLGTKRSTSGVLVWRVVRYLREIGRTGKVEVLRCI